MTKTEDELKKSSSFTSLLSLSNSLRDEAVSPWHRFVDPRMDNSYYHNFVTKETQWERPKELDDLPVVQKSSGSTAPTLACSSRLDLEEFGEEEDAFQDEETSDLDEGKELLTHALDGDQGNDSKHNNNNNNNNQADLSEPKEEEEEFWEEEDVDEELLKKVARSLKDVQGTSREEGKAREEEGEQVLTNDAFSLLYTCKRFGGTYFFACFVVLLQGGMLLVTFLDLYDTSKKGQENTTNGASNRMSLPAGSSMNVNIAQFLGMLMTSMVMAADGDLVIGMSQLLHRYNKKLEDVSPNVTWFRWLITGVLQSFVGVLLLVDSFILSMQSATVIDLALNLTALHFIQEIDEMSFTLAVETGLLGEDIQKDCEHVQGLKVRRTPSQKKKLLFRKRFLIFLMTAGLLVCFFRVMYVQTTGTWRCNLLYIQFGDAYAHEMEHYSGVFTSKAVGRVNINLEGKSNRNEYIDETGTYKLAYCSSQKAWTVSKVEDDPCNEMFRSPETETYDVMEVANSNWVVKPKEPRETEVEVDWLKISCINSEECKERGCGSRFCTSKNDFGADCRLKEKCQHFGFDNATKAELTRFPTTHSVLDTLYVRLPDVTFYHRPMYLPMDKEYPGKLSVDVASFILFTGRRWAFFGIANDKLSNFASDDFAAYFDSDVFMSQNSSLGALEHFTKKYAENYIPLLLSSPVEYGGESDGVDPTTVTWVLAKHKRHGVIGAAPDSERPLSARLTCSSCNSSSSQNSCRYGTCQRGLCSCGEGYGGNQCEYQLLSSHFNGNNSYDDGFIYYYDDDYNM